MTLTRVLTLAPPLALRDIRVPAPAPWWPPAPGWWLLLACVLGTVAMVALWRRRRAQRRQRADAVFDAALASATTPAAQVAAISDLLRRSARRVDARADRLQGEDWLQFLDAVHTARAGLARGGRRAAHASFAARPLPDAPLPHAPLPTLGATPSSDGRGRAAGGDASQDVTGGLARATDHAANHQANHSAADTGAAATAAEAAPQASRASHADPADRAVHADSADATHRPFSRGAGRVLLDGGFRREVDAAAVRALLPLARVCYRRLLGLPR